VLLLQQQKRLQCVSAASNVQLLLPLLGSARLTEAFTAAHLRTETCSGLLRCSSP
jgi:uncharacterized protein HemY